MDINPVIKMLRIIALIIIFIAGNFCLYGAEIFSSGDMLNAGEKCILVLGRLSEIKPELKLSGGDSVQVPVSGGSVDVFSNTISKVEMEQELSEILVLFDFRPREGLQYRFKAGQVRSFSLEYSSGSQVNSLDATNAGFVWGVGVGGQIFPGSIVSNGIRWDLGYTQRNVSLDRFKGGDIVYQADNQWKQEEFQANINLSRRYKWVEPFGGIKMMHVYSRLKDATSTTSVSGKNGFLSPFIGVQMTPYFGESILIEASFVGELSLSFGAKVQF